MRGLSVKSRHKGVINDQKCQRLAALAEADVDHRRVAVIAMASHQHDQMTKFDENLSQEVSCQLSKIVYTNTDWVRTLRDVSINAKRK